MKSANLLNKTVVFKRKCQDFAIRCFC